MKAKKLSISKIREFTLIVLERTKKHSCPSTISTKINFNNVLKFKKEQGISIYAILMKTISDAVMSDKRFKILNSAIVTSSFFPKLFVFDQISFSCTFAKKVNNEDLAVSYIFEDIENRSMKNIDEEVKKASSMDISKYPQYIKLLRFLHLPYFIKRLLFWLNDLFGTPDTRHGTMSITNLGPCSVDFLLPVSAKTSIFGFAGIQKENGNSFVKLYMTLNHYAVDGRVCAELMDIIKEKLESL